MDSTFLCPHLYYIKYNQYIYIPLQNHYYWTFDILHEWYNNNFQSFNENKSNAAFKTMFLKRVCLKVILHFIFIPLTVFLLNNWTYFFWGPSWPWSHGWWIYNYLCNQCLSPLVLWVRISIRARCTTLCDKVCQWLVTGRGFSQGPPVSSTNKTNRHDITEILLKVALNAIKQTFFSQRCIHCKFATNVIKLF